MSTVSPAEPEPVFAPSPSPPPVPALSGARRRFLSRSYFPLLDGLRCLSIVAVVWFHAAGSTFTGILSRGKEGVSLFFVISGFLITTILLREQSATGAISLRRFYLRRTLRIFPLYYAMLALYIVLVALVEKQSAVGEQFWHNLPYFSTYTSNWFVPLDSDRVIFFFAWSLATEEQFYLFWPSIVRARLLPGLLVAAMVGLLALHYGAFVASGTGMLAPSGLLTRVLVSLSPPICLGAIAAILLHQPTTFGWVERWIGWRWSAAAALAATLAVLVFEAVPDWILHLAMTWLVVASVLRPQQQPLSHLLAHPLVKHIGVVSYGIYLMHMLCINLVLHLLIPHKGPLVFVLALAVSVVAATLSYRLFEAPLLRWKDRLAKRP